MQVGAIAGSGNAGVVESIFEGFQTEGGYSQPQGHHPPASQSIAATPPWRLFPTACASGHPLRLDEPDINPTVEAFAAHYGLAITPARVGQTH